jgi:hypothetical protein
MNRTALIIGLVTAGVVSLWIATMSYAAGLQAGEWKGRAETMEKVMGAAVYNLGTLNAPEKTK